MKMKTKQEVLSENLKEWLATKPYSKERRLLTKRLAGTIKVHARSIGRSMRRLQLKDKTIPEHRGRPKLYTKDAESALNELWQAMDYPCAELMHPMLDEYISAFIHEKRWTYGLETEALVKGISIGSLKQRIAAWRERVGTTRGYSATVPSMLKDLIPVRKSHTWAELPIGYLQTDSVVHCGDLLTSDVIYSVGAVDFRSYWSEYTAQWNKGEEATKESLTTIRERFPFTWNELHPDSGNEFINYHVKRWADTNHIDMTRSEPYKKNDNMCIEERNNNIPRRHLGYVRMDGKTLVPLVSEILQVACLIHNHFRPVRRMVKKERRGARWHRTYEKVAKTPYQRILDDAEVSQKIKRGLRAEHKKLNPLQLGQELDRLKTQLSKRLSK